MNELLMTVRLGMVVTSLTSCDHSGTVLTKFLKVSSVLSEILSVILTLKCTSELSWPTTFSFINSLPLSSPLPCKFSFCLLSCSVSDILQGIRMLLALSSESENVCPSSLYKCPY